MRDRSSAGRTYNRGRLGIYWESEVKRMSSLLEGVLDRSQSRTALEGKDSQGDPQRRMMAMAMRIIRTW